MLCQVTHPHSPAAGDPRILPVVGTTSLSKPAAGWFTSAPVFGLWTFRAAGGRALRRAS